MSTKFAGRDVWALAGARKEKKSGRYRKERNRIVNWEDRKTVFLYSGILNWGRGGG